MRSLGQSGLWETFIPGLAEGAVYKFELHPRVGPPFTKADPFALAAELPPQTASVTSHFDRYALARSPPGWRRAARSGTVLDRPMSIYEVHAASWRRNPLEGNRSLTWRELGAELVPYLKEMGFTHVELMPVMEHPFSGSWGYQVTGFFAPTSRHGSPDDFRAFVDECHVHGIGVILDWVPGHFPKDAHGLARFDGTALYEHEDPRQGEHTDWGTLIFNYGRHEVRNFLITNALFWLESFHIDGLRVDAVASMLYLDYSRKAGEWVPNRYGGRENLDAIDFLRELNALTHEHAPGTVTIAEESTAFPAVSRPTWVGGLGFTYKWNMGWMHDILTYVSKDPGLPALGTSAPDVLDALRLERELHPAVLARRGRAREGLDDEQGAGRRRGRRRRTLRALYTFMFAHPGKKLLFMGAEIGQWREWDHDGSLDWHLLDRAAARRPQALRRRPQPSLPRAAGALRGGLRRRRASSGSTATTTTRASSRSSAAPPIPPTGSSSC